MKSNSNTSRLDAEELLHLALQSSNSGHHENAIDYLKRVIELSPDNAKAYYFLGAEHAEIGIYSRAVEDMTKAVELDSSLSIASFQLGLLHVTSANIDDATKAWEPLDQLDEKDPLRLFKTGLLHLTKDEFNECIKYLEKGISLNTSNEPLNDDMKRLIDQVKTSQGDTGADPLPSSTTKSQTSPTSHVLLSAYRSDIDKKNEDSES